MAWFALAETKGTFVGEGLHQGPGDKSPDLPRSDVIHPQIGRKDAPGWGRAGRVHRGSSISRRTRGCSCIYSFNESLLSTYYVPTIFKEWFSKYGSLTSNISIIWELVRNADSWVPPQTYCVRSSGGCWGVGGPNLCFDKVSRRLWCILTFEAPDCTMTPIYSSE